MHVGGFTRLSPGIRKCSSAGSLEDRIERWDPAVRDLPDSEKFVKPRDRQPRSKDRWDKTVNSMSKLRCTTSRGDEPVSGADGDGAVDQLAKSILYDDRAPERMTGRPSTSGVAIEAITPPNIVPGGGRRPPRSHSG